MDDFKSPKTELVNSPLDRLDTSSRQVDRLGTTTGQPDLALGEVVQLVEAIARHLRPAEPLQHLKELQLKATEGWLSD